MDYGERHTVNGLDLNQACASVIVRKVFLFLSVVKMGVLLTCSTTSAASEGRQCVPHTV